MSWYLLLGCAAAIIVAVVVGAIGGVVFMLCLFEDEPYCTDHLPDVEA